jgi:phage-related protein
MKRKLVFYRAANGRCPIVEFLESLPSKHSRKVTWVLKLVEELDAVPETYLKKLEGSDEIWECRVKSGSNAYRIFCFFSGNSVVILTHGMTKKSRKTPAVEIRKAEAMRKDYLTRRKKDERP